MFWMGAFDESNVGDDIKLLFFLRRSLERGVC